MALLVFTNSMSNIVSSSTACCVQNCAVSLLGRGNLCSNCIIHLFVKVISKVLINSFPAKLILRLISKKIKNKEGVRYFKWWRSMATHQSSSRDQTRDHPLIISEWILTRAQRKTKSYFNYVL